MDDHRPAHTSGDGALHLLSHCCAGQNGSGPPIDGRIHHGPRTLSEEHHHVHAKCLLVDDCEAPVTSANFSDAAYERNPEVGVRLSNPTHAAALRQQFDRLIQRGVLCRLSPDSVP